MSTEQAIQALQAAIDALRAEVQNPPNPAPPAGSTVQIDPIVPSGTAGTVTLDKTGHVLSIARPDLGEMFVGYAGRVSKQCGGDVAAIGALFLGVQGFTPHTYRNDPTAYPEMADEFFNPRAYMTPDEQARYDASRDAWASTLANLRNQAAANPAATAAQANVVKTNRAHRHGERDHGKHDAPPTPVGGDTTGDGTTIPIGTE